MQLDLETNGFEWYCFAANQGMLFVIATRAKESATAANGFGVSPMLEPLTRYGFTVYNGPGR